MRMTKILLAVTVFFILLGAGSLPARASSNVACRAIKASPMRPLSLRNIHR